MGGTMSWPDVCPQCKGILRGYTTRVGDTVVKRILACVKRTECGWQTTISEESKEVYDERQKRQLAARKKANWKVSDS